MLFQAHMNFQFTPRALSNPLLMIISKDTEEHKVKRDLEGPEKKACNGTSEDGHQRMEASRRKSRNLALCPSSWSKTPATGWSVRMLGDGQTG